MSIKYPRAPITEAIIDIRIEALPESKLDILSAVCDQLKEQYPHCQDIRILQGTVQFLPSVSTSATQQQSGYRLTDSSTKSLVQIRLDGLTYTVLHPYASWNDFYSQAKKLWQIYNSAVCSENITRMAVRYINKINIPLPIRDFRDFMRTYPEVSSDMEPFINGYFMQLQCPQPGLEAMAVITQGMIPSPPGVVSILLDIDLFRSNNLPNKEDNLWELFESFRECKNNIFEASITNRTRELFK